MLPLLGCALTLTYIVIKIYLCFFCLYELSVYNFTGTTASFSSGAVRLTNGYAPTVGRVEIWYSDQWNTVCDDFWSIDNAKVVCRQLGYQGASIAHRNAHFGEGSGEILLDNVDCTGTETSLLQCKHNGLYSHNCDHNEDAGVTCESYQITIALDRLCLALLYFATDYFSLCCYTVH